MFSAPSEGMHFYNSCEIGFLELLKFLAVLSKRDGERCSGRVHFYHSLFSLKLMYLLPLPLFLIYNISLFGSLCLPVLSSNYYLEVNHDFYFSPRRFWILFFIDFLIIYYMLHQFAGMRSPHKGLLNWVFMYFDGSLIASELSKLGLELLSLSYPFIIFIYEIN